MSTRPRPRSIPLLNRLERKLTQPSSLAGPSTEGSTYIYILIQMDSLPDEAGFGQATNDGFSAVFIAFSRQRVPLHSDWPYFLNLRHTMYSTYLSSKVGEWDKITRTLIFTQHLPTLPTYSIHFLPSPRLPDSSPFSLRQICDSLQTLFRDTTKVAR